MSRKQERLYSVWCTMKSRCYNPQTKSYPYYGAMGITVCPQWRNDYPAFKAWAERSGYRPGLTLDRRDNNRGYSPDNCKWSTRREQVRGRRYCLRPETVSAIKAMLAAGMRQIQIRRQLGVSKFVVSKIHRGKAWV